MAEGKVLVVDDEEHIVELLKFNLENTGYKVITANNGNDAISLAKENKPDLVLLDLMLPGMDGFDVCKEIKRNTETRKTAIIMLTAKGEEFDKILGLELGADDYITKPFGIMELISRVKALLRRTGSSDEEKLIGIGSLFIDDEKRVAYVDDKPVELTYKEYELLKYLALNRGIVLTRDNIMDRIWSTDYEGESRTLDVHIKTLRHKLGAAGNYIKTVRNVGYFMDDEAR